MLRIVRLTVQHSPVELTTGVSIGYIAGVKIQKHMNETLFKFLWNFIPGVMALATAVWGLIYFSQNFNKVVIKVETLDLRVGIIEKDVQELKVNIDKRFEKIEARMERLEVRMDRLEVRMERMEEKFDKLNDKLDRLLLEVKKP